MQPTSKFNTLATGLAMFSMFFGAGNVVFPLALGQIAQDKNFFAILGMLITAVGVPFAGLLAMTLYNGDYKRFFGRIGKVPGFFLAAGIMGLIGPFGAMPRCIALSFSTAKMFLGNVSLPMFSIVACLLIWVFTFRRTNIVSTLGYVLTPLLLGSLGVIIICGFVDSPAAPLSTHENFDIFLKGLKDGYQTMDLLGAFFFSSVIIASLKKNIEPNAPNYSKRLMISALQATAIGAGLLALVYVGFSYIASFHGSALKNISSDELISVIAVHVLGPKAAMVACIAVSLACLTTAIALAVVFAEFVQKEISGNKINYSSALIGTLVVTFFVSTLNFTGIAAFLLPILQVCYPGLIVLCLVNIAYKLKGYGRAKELH
ncbi:MAG: branched-chain amino acid transport system II carrier protein [Parachlamydiaceae bacterium]|nr:branched-chain amino acid transport system II carrier protein [Parachlamydiaceae bacterium]